MATFEFPVVFDVRALLPTAVLLEAVVLATKAFIPIAVFEPPVVLTVNAFLPKAVLETPLVKSSKTSKPKPVLLVALDKVPVPASLLISILSLKLVISEDIPTPLIVLLNVAAPAADISRTKAFIPEPPSLPLNIMSLS